MGRWEPDAAGRLREAAMALYAERGYDGTTVAEIADRAGVTARTFFRHFADKREVLFAGSEQLERHMVEALAAAPPDASPMEAVTAAVLATAEFFDDIRRDYSRRRAAVITSTPELRERELIKMATLTTALTDGLLARGVAPDVAALAAETGVAVFRVSFERWIAAPDDVPIGDVLQATLKNLAALTA
ncbi:TetR/AcrR family transcriptional regulator [Kribbella sindirgiensis]|uniref:TetR family transcriptional regulator n=1 Tax=Kribbella sindirgiensis TaxID=1124744 RepID=A0A4R0I598_9ACTN|nr:TetR/AcrR family transcriptional regulator [Kribbella sindirgiensis]TCC24003.1 TetR family transcriptional regulator [Kribbella sindirgiensis]